MATAKTKTKAGAGANTRKAGRRDRDVINTSIPSNQATQKVRLRRPTRIDTSYVSANSGTKSGYTTFKLERGDATYRALTWGIECTAAIADITTQIGGKHYVLREKLSNYIGQVRTVANGSIMQEFSQEELTMYNEFHGIAYGPVYDGFAYPGDNVYDSRAMTDAFALGTNNLKSLTLELQQLNTFDADTMELVIMPHVVDMPQPAYYVNTSDRLNTSFTGVGEHTYTDIPIGNDIRNVWIKGDGITHVKLVVDGDTFFDMDLAQYQAYLMHHGRDVDAMEGNWILDFHSEAEPRSLAALDGEAERRRNAKYKLTLTTTEDVTPVEFILQNADFYRKIR
jgi:hypothetical protein